MNTSDTRNPAPLDHPMCVGDPHAGAKATSSHMFQPHGDDRTSEHVSNERYLYQAAGLHSQYLRRQLGGVALQDKVTEHHPPVRDMFQPFKSDGSPGYAASLGSQYVKQNYTYGSNIAPQDEPKLTNHLDSLGRILHPYKDVCYAVAGARTSNHQSQYVTQTSYMYGNSQASQDRLKMGLIQPTGVGTNHTHQFYEGYGPCDLEAAHKHLQALKGHSSNYSTQYAKHDYMYNSSPVQGKMMFSDPQGSAEVVGRQDTRGSADHIPVVAADAALPRYTRQGYMHGILSANKRPELGAITGTDVACENNYGTVFQHPRIDPTPTTSTSSLSCAAFQHGEGNIETRKQIEESNASLTAVQDTANLGYSTVKSEFPYSQASKHDQDHAISLAVGNKTHVKDNSGDDVVFELRSCSSGGTIHQDMTNTTGSLDIPDRGRIAELKEGSTTAGSSKGATATKKDTIDESSDCSEDIGSTADSNDDSEEDKLLSDDSAKASGNNANETIVQTPNHKEKTTNDQENVVAMVSNVTSEIIGPGNQQEQTKAANFCITQRNTPRKVLPYKKGFVDNSEANRDFGSMVSEVPSFTRMNTDYAGDIAFVSSPVQKGSCNVKKYDASANAISEILDPTRPQETTTEVSEKIGGDNESREDDGAASDPPTEKQSFVRVTRSRKKRMVVSTQVVRCGEDAESNSRNSRQLKTKHREAKEDCRPRDPRLRPSKGTLVIKFANPSVHMTAKDRRLAHARKQQKILPKWERLTKKEKAAKQLQEANERHRRVQLKNKTEKPAKILRGKRVEHKWKDMPITYVCKACEFQPHSVGMACIHLLQEHEQITHSLHDFLISERIPGTQTTLYSFVIKDRKNDNHEQGNDLGLETDVLIAERKPPVEKEPPEETGRGKNDPGCLQLISPKESLLLEIDGFVKLLSRWVEINAVCPKCHCKHRGRKMNHVHHCMAMGEQKLCENCGRYIHNHSFKSHMEREHHQSFKIKRVVCPHCKKEMSATTITHHIKTFHRGTKVRIPCGICGQLLSSNHSLKRHEAIHRTDIRYHCPICNRGFTQSTNMKNHMRQHTGEQPYKCEHCEKAFTHKVSMKTHLKKQHGIDLWKDGQTGGGRPKKQLNTGCPLLQTVTENLPNQMAPMPSPSLTNSIRGESSLLQPQQPPQDSAGGILPGITNMVVGTMAVDGPKDMNIEEASAKSWCPDSVGRAPGLLLGNSCMMGVVRPEKLLLGDLESKRWSSQQQTRSRPQSTQHVDTGGMEMVLVADDQMCKWPVEQPHQVVARGMYWKPEHMESGRPTNAVDSLPGTSWPAGNQQDSISNL